MGQPVMRVGRSLGGGKAPLISRRNEPRLADALGLVGSAPTVSPRMHGDPLVAALHAQSSRRPAGFGSLPSPDLSAVAADAPARFDERVAAAASAAMKPREDRHGAREPMTDAEDARAHDLQLPNGDRSAAAAGPPAETWAAMTWDERLTAMKSPSLHSAPTATTAAAIATDAICGVSSCDGAYTSIMQPHDQWVSRALSFRLMARAQMRAETAEREQRHDAFIRMIAPHGVALGGLGSGQTLEQLQVLLHALPTSHAPLPTPPRAYTWHVSLLWQVTARSKRKDAERLTLHADQEEAKVQRTAASQGPVQPSGRQALRADAPPFVPPRARFWPPSNGAVLPGGSAVSFAVGPLGGHPGGIPATAFGAPHGVLGRPFGGMGMAEAPPAPIPTPAATRRIMRELKSLMSGSSEHEHITCTLPEENDAYTWNVVLRTPPGSRLADDLTRHAERHGGEAGVTLAVHFNGEYPMLPPFVRVVAPRFACAPARPNSTHGPTLLMPPSCLRALPLTRAVHASPLSPLSPLARSFHTGHVTIGGSICMHELTSSGWSAATTMPRVLEMIHAAMLEGNGAVDQVRGHVAYSYGEARHAFARVARQHGWHA